MILWQWRAYLDGELVRDGEHRADYVDAVDAAGQIRDEVVLAFGVRFREVVVVVAAPKVLRVSASLSEASATVLLDLDLRGGAALLVSMPGHRIELRTGGDVDADLRHLRKLIATAQLLDAHLVAQRDGRR